jgi:flagellar biosynthesis anti-sigma factor FlgM
MKINGFQNIPSVLQTLKSNRTTASESLAATPKPAVAFSSFAETLQNLQRASAQAAQARQPRVDELVKQEAAGTLKVDLSKVAARLVDLNVVDMGQ